ncbi:MULTISPECIES: DUF6061 family protein [unclassified Paenibacillus]|uniref:DUF6061 family protein n=1 Tax=unclassified Paenibacillus TaxID=185978 RepID=UPI0036382A7E
MGGTYRFNCYEIENSLDLHPTARSRLRWLKENKPYTFTELLQRDVLHVQFQPLQKGFNGDCNK